MNSRIIGACIVAATASCKSAEPSDLQVMVHSFCTDLESSLATAAKHHHQLAPALDGNKLTSDQLERANADLALESVGNTAEVRRARLHDIGYRAQYCISFHKVEGTREQDLEVRLATIGEAMQEKVMSGEMPTAAKTAELLDQFHEVMHEINALPLKQ